jgi:adiponectin receptor
METANAAGAKARNMGKSLLFEDTPAWMQVDPKIRRGYREELNTIGACIKSLFYVHNEFVNIWSHLLPGLVHLFLLGREAFAVEHDAGLSSMDAAMVQLYILSAIACLLSSVRDQTPPCNCLFFVATRLRIVRAPTTC